MAVYRCVSCKRTVSDKSSACVYCGCSMNEIVAAYDREKENALMNMKDFYIEGNTLIKYKGNDEHVIVPDGVKIIGRQAFTCRSTLLSVVLPEGVVSIGEQAFDSCYNLEKVVIPSTVTLIDKSAFASCRSLESVVIPNGVPYIAIKTFIGCTSLKSVTLPDSITAIGEYAFNRCYRLSEITIGDNVTEIGEDAFSYCRSMKALSLGKGIDSIKWNTFAYCDSLEKISFKTGIREIVYSAFDNCPAIQDVYFDGPEEVWKQVMVARTKNTSLIEANYHFEYTKPITGIAKAKEAAKAKAEAEAAKQISFDLLSAEEEEIAEKAEEMPVVSDLTPNETAEASSMASTPEEENELPEKEPEAEEVVETEKEVTAEAPVPAAQPGKSEEAPSAPVKKNTGKKPSSVRTTPRSAVSDLTEEFKTQFYHSYMAKIPSEIASAQAARAKGMTSEAFETLSEALFLVPAEEAYEFGCMCLYLGKFNWAFRSFLSAAGKGNLPSQFYVGCCFLWGIDTTKKIVDAARWLTKCKNDPLFGEEAKKLIAIVDAELEKPENAGLKVKRGNK